MRLCLALGCTLAELGERMTSQEFGLWIAYHQIEPFGEVRADLRAGIVASTVANYAGRMRTKEAGAAQPSEFMPFLKHDEPEQTVQEPDPIAYFNSLRKS